MIGHRVATAAVAAAAALAVATAVPALTTAGAGRAAAAPACDGVWVVVDPGDLGGDPTLRCAPGDPHSGYEALRLAGHVSVDVPIFPGMVCTIDGRPDPCNGAPAHAYWSYWWAEPGGSWRYSTSGAHSRDPTPGEAEGWRFGDGREPPRIRPPDPEPDEPATGSTETSAGTGSTDTLPASPSPGVTASDDPGAVAADDTPDGPEPGPTPEPSPADAAERPRVLAAGSTGPPATGPPSTTPDATTPDATTPDATQPGDPDGTAADRPATIRAGVASRLRSATGPLTTAALLAMIGVLTAARRLRQER